jgi:hypothetical protein
MTNEEIRESIKLLMKVWDEQDLAAAEALLNAKKSDFSQEAN